MTVNLSDLRSVADVMREKGIKSLKWGDVELELGTKDAPPLKDGAKADPDECKCGHPLSGHVNGLCVLGPCEPQKCLGEQET